MLGSRDTLIKIHYWMFLYKQRASKFDHLPLFISRENFIAGWGGAAGYVYQKAYVEFFCSPEKLNALVEKAKNLPFVTYIAVNKKGATAANIGPTDVNAVTWGVFPAKEVIQPTVVDPASFMVWKDEAFQAWEQEWASLYPDGDPSRKILEEVIYPCFPTHILSVPYWQIYTR
jgi:hypothetical protein